jgi:hypothetical protein
MLFKHTLFIISYLIFFGEVFFKSLNPVFYKDNFLQRILKKYSFSPLFLNYELQNSSNYLFVECYFSYLHLEVLINIIYFKHFPHTHIIVTCMYFMERDQHD